MKEITADFSKLQTPYSLDPADDPRHYLKGLQPWPGLPTHSCRRHLKAEDRKKIGKLFAELDEQQKLEHENDSQRAREHARQLFQSPHEADLVRAEELTRASLTMNITACLAARAKQKELVAEGRALAVKLAGEMAQALLPEFLEDAVGVEGRLLRGGIALSHEIYNQGQAPTLEWELWGDALLSNAFAGCWYLVNYWPTEFVEGKYDAAAWAEFLKEISKD